MTSGYQIYKPLRNLLRRYNLWSGLLASYHFIQYLDYDHDLPAHLRPRYELSRMERMRRGIVQWEFEILIREIILNCSERGGKNFDSWTDVANCINHIKRIENELYGAHDGPDDDVLFELVRIAHRQFPWQVGINQEHIARYHWLYNQEGLAEHFQETFGMDATQALQISLALAGHLLKRPTIEASAKNQINGVSQNRVDQYLGRLCVGLSEAKEAYRSVAQYNVNWAYTFNLFRSKPLLLLPNGRYFCPIPDFLLRRVTSGIYFDLVTVPDLTSRHLGPAVQRMIGKIASHSSDGELQVHAEMKYGSRKRRKDSIDWIVSDGTASLFVESKAARVSFAGMSDLQNRESIRREFDRVRAFARQSYVTLADALAGQYPHWKPDERPIYLVIVTLEDWQAIGIHIEREVHNPLKEELMQLGIDPELLVLVPMSFCPVPDFEAAMHVARKIGLHDVFAPKAEGEYPQWALGTYITQKFQDELADFKPSTFAGEWNILTGTIEPPVSN